MKVYEIVTEAPNVRRGILDPEITDVEPKDPSKTKAAAPKNGANAFSQMANQLGSTSSTGGTNTPTATGQTHTANPNNPNNAVKPSTSTGPTPAGPQATTNPQSSPASNTQTPPNSTSKPSVPASSSSKPAPTAKELLKTLKKNKAEKEAKVALIKEQRIAGFVANPIVQAIGKTAAIFYPIYTWVEEMAAINVLWKVEDIDGVTAQGYRADVTARCFTEMISNFAGFILVAKSSATIVTTLRTMVAGVPGGGQVAWIVMTLAQIAFFALLNRPEVQQYICKMIMSYAWPVADWVGSLGELGAGNNAKVKDAVLDVANKPGALPAPNKQPTNTPSSGQGAQPSEPSGSGDRMVTGDELFKSLRLQ
jgi:hypothetical protein